MDMKKSAELLIASGANLDLPSVDGNTPLMRAADRGIKKIVLMLLQAGAKTDLKEKHVGKTAFDFAHERKEHGESYRKSALLIKDFKPTPTIKTLKAIAAQQLCCNLKSYSDVDFVATIKLLPQELIIVILAECHSDDIREKIHLIKKSILS